MLSYNFSYNVEALKLLAEAPKTCKKCLVVEFSVTRWRSIARLAWGISFNYASDSNVKLRDIIVAA